MQCGITCLQMICKHFGKELSIETLSRYCFATTEGVSLLGISEAANKLGLHSICGTLQSEKREKSLILKCYYEKATITICPSTIIRLRFF